jgi:hypothetical protein
LYKTKKVAISDYQFLTNLINSKLTLNLTLHTIQTPFV